MTVRPLLLACAAVAVAACAAPPLHNGSGFATPEGCVALFEEYDRLARFPSGRADPVTGRRSNPVVEKGLELRRTGCVTMTRQLVIDAPAAPVGESGVPIRPTSLHAGVVTSHEAEARVRAALEARGIPARSVGGEGLGRRIYLGPFRTEGGLAAAAEAARSFGFIAPYPSVQTF